VRGANNCHSSLVTPSLHHATRAVSLESFGALNRLCLRRSKDAFDFMTSTSMLDLAIAIAAGVSAVIAAVYTVVTAKILRVNRGALDAMRAQVVELTRPRVVIWPWVRLGTQLFCLTVKNSGSTSATHLRLTLDRDFFVFGEQKEDRNLRHFAAFTNSIDALAPSAEMVFYLGVSHQMFRQPEKTASMPLTFSIRAEYRLGESKYDETTFVDLRPFLESAVPQDPIAEEIEKVSKELKRLGDRIQVLARNREDRR
jgi:hypothetical protein